jgi:glycerol-3-phosphate cytidylyltransferase
MKNIITYGTFDTFHYGHLELLIRASKLGNRLIVGLSTDDFNATKGKKCQFSFNKRKEWLNAISLVNIVIPEENWNQKSLDIQKYNIDCLVMGDDWQGQFDFLKKYCSVIYLPRTKKISTTQIKNICKL